MIVVQLIGGLGNQLFQYATGKALALRRNVPFGVDRRIFDRPGIRPFGLDAFATDYVIPEGRNLPPRKAPLWAKIGYALRPRRMRLYRERGLVFDPTVLELPDETYLRGYFQSESYFIDQEAALRREFRFVRPPTGRNSLLLDQIKSSLSVSLHIRRGDFVESPKIHQLFGTCDLRYYEASATYLQSRIKSDLAFFVFSDDPEWAEENLRLPFPLTIIDHNASSPEEDLRLMSACRHHITANSSFSWWGAWLNPSPDKIVVTPKTWFRDSSLDASTLIPASWLRL